MKEAKARLNNVMAKIQQGVELVVVSKNRTVDQIIELYEQGQYSFGENKVQELITKSQALSRFNIEWHFIGHLQKNKVNQLLKIEGLKAIHSIDSLELLAKVLEKKLNFQVELYLQVNTSGEEQKKGFKDLTKIAQAIEMIRKSDCFCIAGLMTIGGVRTENFEEEANRCFLSLKEMKQELEQTIEVELKLSMGMSRDFVLAQEYGSSVVRIGSLLFV